MISGAIRPTSGSIRFQGKEIGGLLPNKICHMGIGRTFQIPRPIHRLSILENALVAAYFGQDGSSTRSESYEAARRAILRCGTKGYDLPQEKFGQWRDIEMTFNPEKMRIK